MKAKIKKLGEKTGLRAEEANNIACIGIAGLLALIVSFFGFFQDGATASEVKDRDSGKDQKSLPEKCQMKPEYGDCKANFTTYYYDAKTNTCKMASGCVGDIFKSRAECQKTCGAENPYPVSKYGGISRDDFRNLK